MPCRGMSRLRLLAPLSYFASCCLSGRSLSTSSSVMPLPKRSMTRAATYATSSGAWLPKSSSPPG
eukprot:11569383-Heterocapsa_arctica.AAC.1